MDRMSSGHSKLFFSVKCFPPLMIKKTWMLLFLCNDETKFFIPLLLLRHYNVSRCQTGWTHVIRGGRT